MWSAANLIWPGLRSKSVHWSIFRFSGVSLTNPFAPQGGTTWRIRDTDSLRWVPFVPIKGSDISGRYHRIWIGVRKIISRHCCYIIPLPITCIFLVLHPPLMPVTIQKCNLDCNTRHKCCTFQHVCWLLCWVALLTDFVTPELCKKSIYSRKSEANVSTIGRATGIWGGCINIQVAVVRKDHDEQSPAMVDHPNPVVPSWYIRSLDGNKRYPTKGVGVSDSSGGTPLGSTGSMSPRGSPVGGALIRGLRPSVMLHSIDCHGSSTTPHTRLGVQPTFR